MKNKFEKNVELDARMVMVAMKGGIDALMNWAFLNRSIFTDTEMVTQRAEWFKKTDKAYQNKVISKIIELEKQTQ